MTGRHLSDQPLSPTEQPALDYNTLSIGPHTITAKYLTDGNYCGSTSTAVTQVVNGADTSIVITTNTPNPSVVGQPVTFTATVTPAPGSTSVEGTISFYDGTTLIGTVPVSGNAGTIVTSNLALGSHNITAVYNGDTKNNPSTSPAVVHTVNKTTTTTTATASPTTSPYGSPVVLTANVVDSSGNPVTGGTVTFTDSSGTVLGTGEVVDGVATYTSTTIPAGTTVTANYGGNSSYSPSQGSVNPQVSCAATMTVVVSNSPNPSVVSNTVTFIALTTSPEGNQLPGLSGNVQFYADGVPIGSPVPTNGTAAIDTNGLSININHQITATYISDGNYCGSTSPAVSQQVDQVEISSTSLTILTSQPGVTGCTDFGCPILFTVTIKPLQSPVPPPYACPTGSVTLYAGQQQIGFIELPSLLRANCMAPDYSVTVEFPPVTTLPAGLNGITAFYSGDNTYSASTHTLTQVIKPINTTTTLTSSINPSIFTGMVAFTATVTASNCCMSMELPKGTVSFYDGSLLLGTSLLDGNGVATYMTNQLLTGSHLIEAVYNPDPNFITSSASLIQVVKCIPTISAVTTSTPNFSVLGDGVAIFASVSSNAPLAYIGSAGAPVGTVTFYDNGKPIGTEPLVNGNAVLNTSNLKLGTHNITVSFSGSTNFCASNSSAIPYKIVVNVLTPQNFYGCQVINKYLNFDDYVNVLTWTPPQGDDSIVCYEIYRDAALTDLAGCVTNKCPYRFEDVNRKRGKVYDYYLVSVNTKGKKSPAVKTRVLPLDNCKED